MTNLAERVEGFRAVCAQAHYSDVSRVLPVDDRGEPTHEGCATYEQAQALGDQMLEAGKWAEYRVERHYYRRG
jgi:hypothetical protein